MSDANLFSFEKPDTKLATEIEKKVEVSSKIPPNYIPITLKSNGKLGYPKVLHFRNFSMDELIDIATSSKQKLLLTIIRCLNQMVYEGYDLSNLHEKDMEVIMLTLYVNFQSSYLMERPYLIDENLKDPWVESNVLYTNIDLTKLELIDIPDTFRNPFTIENKLGMKAEFSMPRVSNIIIAEEYVNKKYGTEERKFSKLQADIEKNEKIKEESKKVPIDAELYKEYGEFLTMKNREFLKILQAQMLVAYGSKKLETIEEKLNANRNVDVSMWREYNKYIRANNFGINTVVKFRSRELDEVIERRFLFQLLDFIPTMDEADNGDDTISSYSSHVINI